MAETSSSRPSTDAPRPSSVRARTIVLQDRTKPSDDAVETPSTPTEHIPIDEAHRSTLEALRKQRTRLKYHRYGIDRVESSTDGGKLAGRSSWGQSHIQRGYRHVQDALNMRSQRDGSHDENSEIDVLYENERGFFFCGIPNFSRNLLSPLDRAAWTDAMHKKSRVNITNAQVPDPSWSWAWRTWYADMGGDVDEEGWEYSFSRGCSWHGNHPWFSSFVRRRRWIRKRTRKHVHVMTNTTFGNAHMLNADYFTIHTGNSKSLASGLTSPRTEETGQKNFARGWDVGMDEASETPKIEDIGTLINDLREAPVDSERIAAVKSFLDNGGTDVFYLAEEIPKITSFFFYGSTCHRLQTLLEAKLKTVRKQESQKAKKGEEADEKQAKFIATLVECISAIETECQRLDFWSDVHDQGADDNGKRAASGESAA